MRYLIAFLLMVSFPVHGQALWRNFFSTNQNPRVTVSAGSNTTVQASTVGVDQRIFTVNSVPPTNVAYASFATNASNATNFWGVLNTTNIPSLNYISNNVGWGTNTSFSGVVNASNEVLTLSGIGTTISPIFTISNGTAASLGAQQASPALMLGGQGWRSGNSTTMPVGMGMYVLPVQGSSANPAGRLTIMQSISNAAPTSTGIYFTDIGQIVAGSSITAGAGLVASSSGGLAFSGRGFLDTPSDGVWRMQNSANTGISAFIFGPNSDNWLRLKVEASTNNPTLSIRTGADGNYASLVASNVTATGTVLATNIVANGTGTNVFAESLFTNNVIISGAMQPTNGIIYQGKHSFTTNFTAIESIQLYNCNGTNIVITLPNCTNSTPWKIYRFAQTNSYASFTLTNANGLQTIHNGIDLSYSVRSAKQTAVYHDGAHWWLAVPDQPNFPNAQFSCSTNIPLTAANTAYPVTFNSTDFNNSLGIGLGLGTNGLHSKMWLTNAGVYEFGPSVVQTFNGNDTIRFWFRTFDTNVPASATPSRGQNGSIRVITVPFVISITQPTPVEIWAESDTTGETLQAEAASGNYPAAPCVICPLKMISHPWP